MSGLRVMTAVPPSLSSSAGGDPDRNGHGANAAFTGVLDRVTTRPTVADPKTSKENVGPGASPKRTRSEAGTSGSDEPDAETAEESPPASTTAHAGTATLDIAALAQAALISTASAVPSIVKTQTPGTKAISEAGQGTAPTAAAELQAIVQQPAGPTSSQTGVDRSTGSIASPPTATDAQASPRPTEAPAAASHVQARSESRSGSAAPLSQPPGAVPTSVAGGSTAVTNAAKGGGALANTVVPTNSGMAPSGTAPATLSRETSGVDTQKGARGAGAASSTVLPANSGVATSGTAPAIPPRQTSGVDTQRGTGVASGTVLPANSGMGTSGTTAAVTSREASQAETARAAVGAAQSSQTSTDAAQAAAVATASQSLQTAAIVQASTLASAAVRPAIQTGARPTPAVSLRAGQDGSVSSPLAGKTATPSPSSLDNTSGKAGKGKAPTVPAATVVAAASSDLSTVPTPTQQVLTGLQSLGKDVGSATRRSDASTTAAADVSTPRNTATSSLKTLTITLNPAHLGPVSITMRLQADTMDIRIAVSNPDTLHLLDKDKHLLAAAVEAMGGSRENLQVGTLAQMSGSGDPTSTGGQNQNTPGRQDAPSSDTSSNGRQAQGQSRSTLQDTSQSDADEPTSTPPLPQARGLDGSLYL